MFGGGNGQGFGESFGPSNPSNNNTNPPLFGNSGPIGFGSTANFPPIGQSHATGNSNAASNSNRSSGSVSYANIVTMGNQAFGKPKPNQPPRGPTTAFGGGQSRPGGAKPNVPVFGQSQNSVATFGSAASSTPAFGRGSAPAFGQQQSPAAVFGGAQMPTRPFGGGSETEKKAPIFGQQNQPTTTFGSSKQQPSFGSGSTKTTFGDMKGPKTSFGGGASSFGGQTKTFGSGLGTNDKKGTKTPFKVSPSGTTTVFGGGNKPKATFNPFTPQSDTINAKTSFGNKSTDKSAKTSKKRVSLSSTPAASAISSSLLSKLPPGIPPSEAEAYFKAIGEPLVFEGSSKPKVVSSSASGVVRKPRRQPRLPSPSPSPPSSPRQGSSQHRKTNEEELSAEEQDDFKLDLADAASLEGCCIEMCSPQEADKRTRTDELSGFEKQCDKVNRAPADLIVKRFQRSSASHKLNIPSEVRTLGTLRQTLYYLETHLMDRERDGIDLRLSPPRVPDITDLYNFCWDRTRMIRKDFILQNYRGGGRVDLIAIDVHERIARYHILSEHELIEEKNFVAQQNMEQLGQTLKSLNEYYDDLASAAQSVECSPYEAECRAYFILCTLDNGGGLDVLKYINELTPAIRAAYPIQFAMQVFLARKMNDWVKFFQLVKEGTYLQTCLLHRYFPGVRENALKCMNRAMRKQLYPVDEMLDLLCFEDQDQVLEVCAYHNLELELSSMGNNHAMIKFGTQEFATSPQEDKKLRIRRSDRVISVKAQHFRRGEICRGVTEYSPDLPLLPYKMKEALEQERRRLYPDRIDIDQDRFSHYRPKSSSTLVASASSFGKAVIINPLIQPPKSSGDRPDPQEPSRAVTTHEQQIEPRSRALSEELKQKREFLLNQKQALEDKIKQKTRQKIQEKEDQVEKETQLLKQRLAEAEEQRRIEAHRREKQEEEHRVLQEKQLKQQAQEAAAAAAENERKEKLENERKDKLAAVQAFERRQKLQQEKQLALARQQQQQLELEQKLQQGKAAAAAAQKQAEEEAREQHQVRLARERAEQEQRSRIQLQLKRDRRREKQKQAILKLRWARWAQFVAQKRRMKHRQSGQHIVEVMTSVDIRDMFSLTRTSVDILARVRPSSVRLSTQVRSGTSLNSLDSLEQIGKTRLTEFWAPLNVAQVIAAAVPEKNKTGLNLRYWKMVFCCPPVLNHHNNHDGDRGLQEQLWMWIRRKLDVEDSAAECTTTFHSHAHSPSSKDQDLISPPLHVCLRLLKAPDVMWKPNSVDFKACQEIMIPYAFSGSSWAREWTDCQRFILSIVDSLETKAKKTYLIQVLIVLSCGSDSTRSLVDQAFVQGFRNKWDHIELKWSILNMDYNIVPVHFQGPSELELALIQKVCQSVVHSTDWLESLTNINVPVNTTFDHGKDMQISEWIFQSLLISLHQNHVDRSITSMTTNAMVQWINQCVDHFQTVAREFLYSRKVSQDDLVLHRLLRPCPELEAHLGLPLGPEDEEEEVIAEKNRDLDHKASIIHKYLEECKLPPWDSSDLSSGKAYLEHQCHIRVHQTHESLERSWTSYTSAQECLVVLYHVWYYRCFSLKKTSAPRYNVRLGVSTKMVREIDAHAPWIAQFKNSLLLSHSKPLTKDHRPTNVKPTTKMKKRRTFLDPKPHQLKKLKTKLKSERQTSSAFTRRLESEIATCRH